MKRLLVLGAGTAGTMAVNKLRPQLPRDEWNITVVDADETHYYQPGYLFIPFGIYRPDEVVKPKSRFIPAGVDFIVGEVDKVVPTENKVLLLDGAELPYDYLIIASGTTPRPDQTPGMDGAEFRKSVHEFYTYEGATALAETLKSWQGGRLVVQICEMPIKCPVAPLEFTFLADAFFTEQGLRDKVDITYVTPLEGAFTKPVASRYLGDMLETRHVHLEPDFMIESVDEEAKKIVSFDEREIPFDLLVTIPVNMGADFVARSGLGDDLNYVPVDKHTLLSTAFDNIFAVGDASDIPASKAGSVAHFAMDLFPENFMRHIQGLQMTEPFDGHANCFIETGHGKGLLIDFNYETEPLPGKYPLP
ncbi:MAG TPA: FAD/NAD(P)-binding oxidoreductase, partial [Actinomycetota bacterium]|nr:FAD/NAD(P)-binding oxidoreductase [Actinomycetota bacterium]